MNSGDEVPPGFATLQQLRTENQITESQYVFFHNRYRRLNRLVCATLASEKSLLSRVQDFNKSVVDATTTLEEEKQIYAENEQKLEHVKTELDLKTKSLREQEQESDILTLTQESLNRELASLQDEIGHKKRESQRLLQPRLTDLESFIQNLTEDIEKFETQIKQAEVDEVKNQKNIQNLAEEIEQLRVVNAKKRKELTNIKAEPERVELEVGITQRKLRGLELEVANLEKENMKKEKSIEQSKEMRKEKTNQLLEVGDSLIRLQDEINAKQENITELKKQLDQEKLKTASFIEERMQMASDISLLKSEYKIENHAFLTSKKALQSKKKEYEKLRRDKELSTEQIKKLHEEKKSLERSIEDIDKQITQTKKALKEGHQDFEEKLLQYLQDASKHGKSNEELINMKLLLETCQENMHKVSRLNKELAEEVVNLKAERYQLVKKTNDVHMAHRTDQEILKSKELVVMDLGKKDEMLKSRLTECRKTYQMVKKSKNRFANLTSNCNQALAEIQEKIKIVQNECEILKNESLSKDRALIEEARILNSAKHTRDSLRFEQLQIQKQLQELNEVVRGQTMNIEQFQNIIKGIDGEMIRARNAFGVAMEKRNKTGMQIINRNDEMCVLHEKRCILEDILNQGKNQCQRLEDEIRMLRLDLKNVHMSIETTKRKIPSQETEKETERIFYKLKAEINDHEKLVEKLSAQLEIQTPELNKQRFRKVKGTDASMEQLESKIAVLDARTNVQNESIMEKKMILEEVAMLTEKLQSQAENGREQTLLLAKTMNEYQSKIKQLTRKLMANVAELAMYQATSLKLEQEIDERKEELKGAQESMKEGQPPSDRATYQWLRIQRDRIFATNEILESMYIGDDEVESRCERRVDSYIDPLSGIPKPYGGNAPFKPSRLGSNMRHFRTASTRQGSSKEAAVQQQISGTN